MGHQEHPKVMFVMNHLLQSAQSWWQKTILGFWCKRTCSMKYILVVEPKTFQRHVGMQGDLDPWNWQRVYTWKLGKGLYTVRFWEPSARCFQCQFHGSLLNFPHLQCSFIHSSPWVGLTLPGIANYQEILHWVIKFKYTSTSILLPKGSIRKP